MNRLGIIAAAAVVSLGLLVLAYYYGGQHTAERIGYDAADERALLEDSLSWQADEIALLRTATALQADTITAERAAKDAEVRVLTAALQQSRTSEASVRAELDSARTAADTLRAVPSLLAALDDCTFLRTSCEASTRSYEDLVASLDTGLALRDSQLVAQGRQLTTARAALDASTSEAASMRVQLRRVEDRGVFGTGTTGVSVGAGVLIRARTGADGQPVGGVERVSYGSLLWDVDLPLLPPATVQLAPHLDLGGFHTAIHIRF